MAQTLVLGIGAVCLALAALGCLYTLGAAAAVRGLAGANEQPAGAWPGVTILKPLSGAGPGLAEDLASFCDQDYRGAMQVLLGVQDAGDAAVAVVARLIAARPGSDLELVVHGPGGGPNPKIANLAALEARIRHEIVVVADADIAVDRGYLGKIVAALGAPGVGAVTCLYRGVARAGLCSRLAAMGIDYHFLPGVLVGLRLGLARPCFGSTIALRLPTLAAIGGFGRFAAQLADDYAIGEAVQALGLKVAVPPLVLAHACSERRLSELLGHELRWARTIRAVDAAGYAGLLVAHPVPLALLGAAFSGWGALGIGLAAAALACRLVLQLQVDHTLGLRADRWWLGPARDLLAFAVYVAGFFIDVVRWRGQRYRVHRDGTLIAIGERRA